MKKKFQYLKLVLPALLIISAFSSYAQYNQEFTFELKTTAANVIASRALIELPGLSGNTAAIIVATPVGATKTLNPQPTGAWYYSGKWNLFNTNHAPLPPGLTYKLTYFLKGDANQFLHTVTQKNLGGNGSFINHPALDNNPNAQFAFFQNHAPGIRTNGLNPFEEKVSYNTAAKKWHISNIGGKTLTLNAVYNIVISLPTVVTTPILLNGVVVIPTNNSSTQPCNCPAELPPNGQAGQVLTSNGPDTSPTWQQPASTGGGKVKGYFKNCKYCFPVDSKISLETTHIYIMPGLTHDIVVPENSKIMLTVSVEGMNSCYVCSAAKAEVTILDNGTEVNGISLYLDVPANDRRPFTLYNYMFDVGAGNHKIEFKAKHNPNSSPILVAGIHSSLLVIPL